MRAMKIPTATVATGLVCVGLTMGARGDEAIIRASLERAAPEIQVTGVSPSPVEGVFEVRKGRNPQEFRRNLTANAG